MANRTLSLSHPSTVKSRRLRIIRDTPWFYRAVVWTGLVLIWHLLAVWKGPFFLPTPAATASALGELVSSGHLNLIANSLKQLLFGFSLAIIVGVPIGLMMGSIRAMDDFLSPYMNTLFITSKEALLPLLIILFGTQFTFRVAIVFLFSIFFVVMNAAAGVRSVDPQLIETAHAFGLKRSAIFWKVILPGSSPYVIAGIRLGYGLAVKGMVVAELWVTTGIGALLRNFAAFRELDLFMALAAIVVTIGIVGTSILKIAENRLRKWTEVTT